MVREIDLFAPELGRDPYPTYAMLRAEAPIARDARGLWVLSRYEDVLRVMRDPETFSSNVGDADAVRDRASIIFTDPPMHTMMRGLVASAFTPRIVEEQRESVQSYCDELLDAMCAKPQAELVEELGYPLPVMVIAQMLGVADGDLAAFKRWSDVFFDNVTVLLIGGDDAAIRPVQEEFDAYFSARLAELRERPNGTLLSELVHVETADGRLTESDLLMLCKVLLVAGNETTTGLIVNAVRAFAEFPDAMRRVREEPSLLAFAIEEALRYYPPFRGVLRRATRDVEFYGETVRAGDRISALLASANRDERVFERPEAFLIDREPNRHLAFGMGIHYCLGAPLARLEGQVAMASLLRRVTRVEVTAPVVVDPILPGGPKELPVRLELASAAAPA